ncbi:hypothetical protein HK102_000677 [Quaeritorhiza haematococci]|nr:hypothetical protein HK102_000677 [Quaeritorhiza haematococci]
MWIDRLLWHSSWAKGENDWWVKGSIYQGRAFDLMVQSPDSFSWAAHINGNALYRLNDPQFVDFLEVVEDYQSFNHYWKPFDVSVWRVLHDFPYTWHIYQKCAHRFVVSDFIKHFGFTVTHKDVLEAAHNPNTYLIHGHQHSAGKVQHSAKFDLDGKPIKAVSYNEWEALEEQDHSISVLIVANSGLLDFSVLAVRSVQRFLAGATQVVIVVPEEDFDRFREKHVSKVAIVKKKNTWDSFASFRTNIRLNADDFCTGSLILHLNADSVITRKLMRKDLFWRKKPIALHGRLPQSKTGEAVANALKHTTPWLHLYPTSLHRRSRDVETEKENAKQNRIAHGGSTSGVALEFSILQKNLWETDQHAMSWIPLMNSWDGDHTAGNEEGSDVSRFYPIIPPFICEGQLEIFQGNAVAERTLYELLEDMVPAEKEGKGNCEAAIKYQQRWLAQNSAAT